MQVKIMRGVPGSGKSTYVKNHFPEAKIISSDLNFMVNGEYKFDPKRLPESHAQCFREFTNLMVGIITPKTDLVVVDNTNLSLYEFAPYYRVAEVYGHFPEIITIDISPQVAAQRNLHGVPEFKVMDMATRMRAATKDVPKWWKHNLVQGWV